MTPPERLEKFRDELQELQDKYGIILQANVQYEGQPNGRIEATGAIIRLLLVKGWKPPEESEAEESEEPQGEDETEKDK